LPVQIRTRSALSTYRQDSLHADNGKPVRICTGSHYGGHRAERKALRGRDFGTLPAPRPPQPRQRVGIDRGERYRQTQPAPPAGRAGDDNSVVWIRSGK
jgi:hypothetical protein